jgi:hypothetical protein
MDGFDFDTFQLLLIHRHIVFQHCKLVLDVALVLLSVLHELLRSLEFLLNPTQLLFQLSILSLVLLKIPFSVSLLLLEHQLGIFVGLT